VTAPFVVIGIGNTLRRDDGVGHAVVEALRDHADPTEIELFTCHQLLPECVVSLEGRRGVVFVDATIEWPAGEIGTRTVEADPEPWRWGHQLRPETVLGLLDDASRPSALVVGIGAADFDYGEELDEPVRAAVPAAVEAILTWLRTVDVTTST
jgi:hydrogenase maturation protease